MAQGAKVTDVKPDYLPLIFQTLVVEGEGSKLLSGLLACMLHSIHTHTQTHKRTYKINKNVITF